VHTTFETKQNYFVSSLSMPLKIANFILFDMFNGGGGEGVGEGACGGGGGGGGGGVDG